MQGKLSEIDIRSILQLIELGQRTGELFVEAYPVQPATTGSDIDPSFSGPVSSKPLSERFWFVFFLNGQIVYASDTTTSLSRLADYLRRYKLDTALTSLTVPAIASTNAPEYGYLWALLENHTLNPAQGRSIIQSMIHETLFDLLSLHQGAFIFEGGAALSPQLMTLEVAPLLARIMKQVQEWKQFYPQIQSPDQCPIISDGSKLQERLSKNTFGALNRYADGKTSIRQIARYLNRDILTVARAVYPYVRQGAIQMGHAIEAGDTASNRLLRTKEFQLWQTPRTPRVVCIDDGLAIRETVQAILAPYGYEVTTIGNPLDTFSQVFQVKPELILCDIAMPELDGYEICAMLRKSTAFRQVPIVMLTGKDGFIDRVRARMVGATDYLTKPFGESELLMLVEKYIGSARPLSASLTADPVENRLKIEMTDATSA